MELLHFNISTRNVCGNLGWEVNKKCHTAEEWQNFTTIKEFIPIRKNGDCIPYYHQHSLGDHRRCSKFPCNNYNLHIHVLALIGVDIDTCGPPGFRVMPDIGATEIEDSTILDTHHSHKRKVRLDSEFSFIHLLLIIYSSRGSRVLISKMLMLPLSKWDTHGVQGEIKTLLTQCWKAI